MLQAQTALHLAPIFVEVSRSGFRHLIELEAASDRAFLVGASRQADVFLDAPGAAAVEFHLERLGNDIWLTPAYRGRRLLVNGEPVRDRIKLTSSVLLRLGDYELRVKVMNEESVEPSTRSSSAPRPLPGDYSLGLPTDTQQTALAMVPGAIEVADTAPIVSPFRSASALPDQRTERMAPAAAALLTAQATEKMAPVRVSADVLPVFMATETVRMKPVAAPQPLARPVLLPAPPAPAPEAAPPPPLAMQETTSFDLASLQEPGLQSLAVAEGLSAHTASSMTADLSVEVAPRSRQSPPRAGRQPTLKSFLDELGLAAKQRPLLVVGGALTCSLVLALALVGASRLSQPSRVPAVQRSTAQAKVSAMASAAPPMASAASLPSASPALLVAPTVAESSASAARNLSTGRLAEAAEQYRSAGAHPDGAVYAELASLLSRRLSAACAAKGSADGGCPEILK